jgi:hypothetical protein
MFKDMGRDALEMLRGGVIKRRIKRRVGLFIDGVGLDRATRRLERKVDMSRLVAGLTSGLQIEIARYYTLVPYEDDARQFAFLDAVARAGLEVVTKRLPPKGVKRQVSMDVHMATDLIAFSCGKFIRKDGGEQGLANPRSELIEPTPPGEKDGSPEQEIKRVAVLVCPTREMSYAIYVSNKLGVETSLSDFGLYGTSDGWLGVDRWVDLSNSETIWRG